MNFAQLRFISATQQLKSFSKAAQLCNVTQPTLSNGISKLEQELGNKIFTRTTRCVALTKFGESIISDLQALLETQQNIFQRAKNFAEQNYSIIKVGVSPLLCSDFTQQWILNFTESHPKLKIVLEENNLQLLQTKLEAKDLDLILVPKIDRVLKPNTMQIYSEELFYVSTDTSTETQVELNNIRLKTFVMVPDACGLAAITRRLIRTTRQQITEYPGRALSYQILVDWALSGLGSAIIPKSKIQSGVRKQQLLCSDTPAIITFEAKWLETEQPALAETLDYLRSLTANL